MLDNTDPEALKVQIADLQEHLARLSVVQQKLIETRDRSTRSSRALLASRPYNTRAIAIRDPVQFAELTAETALDLFGVEFALLWPISSTGDLAEARAPPWGQAVPPLTPERYGHYWSRVVSSGRVRHCCPRRS